MTLALLVGCATPGERSREVEAHLKLGLSALVVGDLPAAARHLRAARRLDPGDPRVPCALGELYRREGRYEKAIAALKEALRLKPGYGEALVNLGTVYLNMGRLPEAERCFRRALEDEQYPTPQAAWTNLGLVRELRGDLQGAEEALLRALRLDPKFSVAHLNLGRVYLRKGDRERARLHLQEAARLPAPDPGIRQEALRLLEGL